MTVPAKLVVTDTEALEMDMNESTPIRDFVITHTKPGKWEMTLAPGLVFRPSEEVGAPNAFHRFMQRVFFGFKWEHHN